MLEKNKNKILLFLLLLVFSFTLTVSSTNAIVTKTNTGIPGFSSGPNDRVLIDGNSIGVLIKGIYDYAVGIVGIIAAIVLMIGGIMWLTAGGSADKTSTAKSLIGASLTGLLLTMTSYMILKTVNPNLVDFKTLEIGQIASIGLGCCETKGAPFCEINTLKSSCIEEGDQWSEGEGFKCELNKCVVDPVKACGNGTMTSPSLDICKQKCAGEGKIYDKFYKIGNVNCCVCGEALPTDCSGKNDDVNCLTADNQPGKCQNGNCIQCISVSSIVCVPGGRPCCSGDCTLSNYGSGESYCENLW